MAEAIVESHLVGMLARYAALIATASLTSCRDAAQDAPSDGGRWPSSEDGGSGGDGGDGVGGEGGEGANESKGGRSENPPSAGASGGDSGHVWVDDPDAWATPEEVGDCQVSAAQMETLQFPSFEWQECGVGCRRAQVLSGPGGPDARNRWSGSRFSDGEYLVSLSVFLSGTRFAGIFRIGDTLDPAVLFKATGDDCVFGFLSPEAIFTLFVTSDPGLTLGRVEVENARVTWLAPAYRTAMEVVDYDGGWGGIQGFRAFTIAAAPGTIEQTLVYAPPERIASPRSSGDRVIFSEWRAEGGAVISWKPGSAAAAVAEGSWMPGEPAVSPTKIVWLAVTGPRAWDGLFETAEVRWIDIDDAGAEQEPIPLSYDTAHRFMATAGDWAALSHCDDVYEFENCRIAAVNLATRDVYELPAPSGMLWQVLGMTPETLLIREADRTHAVGSSFTHIVWLDLDAVPSMTPPVPDG